MIRRLNAKEEAVMNILWDIRKGFVHDIIAEMPEPHPHYNTISSIVRKLESEGYIGHTTERRSHKYYPIASKKAYRAALFEHLYASYFGGSKKKFLKYTIEKLEADEMDVKSVFMKLRYKR